MEPFCRIIGVILCGAQISLPNLGTYSIVVIHIVNGCRHIECPEMGGDIMVKYQVLVNCLVDHLRIKGKTMTETANSQNHQKAFFQQADLHINNQQRLASHAKRLAFVLRDMPADELPILGQLALSNFVERRNHHVQAVEEFLDQAATYLAVSR